MDTLANDLRPIDGKVIEAVKSFADVWTDHVAVRSVITQTLSKQDLVRAALLSGYFTFGVAQRTGVSEIIEQTGMTSEEVKVPLCRLWKRGDIIRNLDGTYRYREDRAEYAAIRLSRRLQR